MKKTKTITKDEELTHVLKMLTKRIEEATVDIHEMKSDFKMVSIRLSNVESNTKITKIDIEKMRENIDDLINISREILSNMVTQQEFKTRSIS